MELTDPNLEVCSDDTSSSASPSESRSSGGLSSPEESTDDIYQVERILKEWSRQGKRQFYIKWRGHSPRLGTRRNTSIHPSHFLKKNYRKNRITGAKI